MKERENCLVKAGFAGSAAEAAQMLNFLSRHEIAASAAAGSLTVYEGNSPSGQAILVAEEDAARAEELLRLYAHTHLHVSQREQRGSVWPRARRSLGGALPALYPAASVSLVYQAAVLSAAPPRHSGKNILFQGRCKQRKALYIKDLKHFSSTLFVL